jgi:hypothetical protein
LYIRAARLTEWVKRLCGTAQAKSGASAHGYQGRGNAAHRVSTLIAEAGRPGSSLFARVPNSLQRPLWYDCRGEGL